MTTRFTDDFRNTVGRDFVVRKWRLNTIQLFGMFAITFVIVYLTGVIMYDIGNKHVFFIVLVFIFSLLSMVTITYAARNRDLVMATEFQNAMLASAAQLGTRFCFITRSDGTIVYIDSGFQKLFLPFMHSGQSTIDGFLTFAGVDDAVKQKVIAAFDDTKGDRVQMTFKDDQGKSVSMMITIDVLPRPKGYFLFRGRDFVEKRTVAAAAAPQEVAAKDESTATSAMLLSQALYTLPEGILITDKNGLITYVNHTLEDWLGYGTGEMLREPITLQQICHRYGGHDVGKAVLDNFEGELMLQHKSHTLVSLTVRQTLFRQQGEVLGVSAIMSKAEKP